MQKRADGFALPELMMIVVLIGILSTTATITTQRARFERQRAALNSTVRDLGLWLDQVRSIAANGTVCTVTLTNNSSLAGGATLASVSPAACAVLGSTTLTIDSAAAAVAGPFGATPSPSATLVISNTGVVLPASTSSLDGFNALEMRLSSTAANLRRCIAISDRTGSLRFGAASSSGGTCSYTAPL
jgi:Tfp pilus assembly protein PilE